MNTPIKRRKAVRWLEELNAILSDPKNSGEVARRKAVALLRNIFPDPFAVVKPKPPKVIIPLTTLRAGKVVATIPTRMVAQLRAMCRLNKRAEVINLLRDIAIEKLTPVHAQAIIDQCLGQKPQKKSREPAMAQTAAT